jgi:AcrR family transcriptional regulator
MPETNETVERILDGTLRSIARQGLRRLSMSDIAEEAAVSRGTVYRYFTDRDQLLNALGEHVRLGYERGLEIAIADDPQGRDRVRAVLEFLRTYAESKGMDRILELQPNFVMDYLGSHLPDYLRAMRKALQPALDDLAAVRDGRIDAGTVNEIFYRVLTSGYFLEHGHARELPKKLLALWDALDGKPTAATKRARAR